jgi:hypothetical protein
MDTVAIRRFADVWTDKAFCKRLRDDPRASLRELGIEIPEPIAVKTVPSKGSPGDADNPSLLEFLLERDRRFAYFFLPSPRSPCSQQASYGHILSRALDDPAFDSRLRRDAAAAIAQLEGTP